MAHDHKIKIKEEKAYITSSFRLFYRYTLSYHSSLLSQLLILMSAFKSVSKTTTTKNKPQNNNNNKTETKTERSYTDEESILPRAVLVKWTATPTPPPIFSES